MAEIKFAQPYSFEDKEYTCLTLDFEALTGRDLIDAGADSRNFKQDNPVPELSKAYLAAVAARAAKVPVDLIISLPAGYFTKVTVSTQNFLLEQVG